jgi:hypothetical protein
MIERVLSSSGMLRKLKAKKGLKSYFKVHLELLSEFSYTLLKGISFVKACWVKKKEVASNLLNLESIC